MRQAQSEVTVEGRLRITRFLWLVFLINLGLFALVGYIANPLAESEREVAGNGPNLLIIFFALGVAAATASFVLRRVFQAKAEREQNPGVVQSGFIIAVTLCETAALFGLMGLFVTGNRYAYLLFAVAALGIILHFPRREQFHAASYKTVG